MRTSRQPPLLPPPPPKHVSWIKRVRDVSYDVATSAWKVQLECFHRLELAGTEHNMKVVARWCPSCQYSSTGSVSV